MTWDESAPGPGEQAPDLALIDEAGRPVQLSSLAVPGQLLVLVFGGPSDEAGLELLRDYRDETLALRRAGVSICGVAAGEPSSLAYLRAERGLGFPLLADPDGAALSRWSMPAEASVLLLDRNLLVKQRAIGPRMPAAAMLRFLRRAVPARRPGWRQRVAHALQAISHALSPAAR
jgi:peroxiredoxin